MSEFNGYVIGNVSVDESGVASGFGSDSYLLSSNVISENASTFEIVTAIEFKYANSGTILDTYFLGPSGLRLKASVSPLPKIQLQVSSDGTTYTDLVDVSSSFTTNTKIFFKIYFNSSTGYVLSSSSDGETWSALGSSVSTARPNTGVEYLKWGLDANNTGSVSKIYLANTKITVDGAVAWEALSSSNASGSVTITKGYYNTGSKEIVTPGMTVDLEHLSANQTIGCKNNLFMGTKNGSTMPCITSTYNPAAGTYDAYVKLSTAIYLDPTKQYIAGGDIVNPTWSFSNFGANFTIVGTPTLSNDYIASGFSDSNYLTCDNYLNNASQSFELVTAVNMSTAATANLGIFDTSGISTHNIRLTTTSSNTARLRVSTTGEETYAVDITGSTTLTVGTKVYIKATYNSSTGYALYTSTDGSSWTTEGTSSTTTRPYQNASASLMIGDNAAEGAYLTGSIYLKDTYIKVNGTKVWEAILPTAVTASKALTYDSANDTTYWLNKDVTRTLTETGGTLGMKSGLYFENTTGEPTSTFIIDSNVPSDSGSKTYKFAKSYVYLNNTYDKIMGIGLTPDEVVLQPSNPTVTAHYTTVGSPSISANYVMSSPTSSNYVKTDTATPSTYNTFEFVTKVKTPSSTSAYYVILGDDSHRSVSISMTQCLMSSNGSSPSNIGSMDYALPTSADIWLRFYHDGSVYTLSKSTDGSTWSTVGQVTSSTKLYGSEIKRLGCTGTFGSTSFPGEIDLNETYIKIDGAVYWRALSKTYDEVSAVPGEDWTWLDGVTYDLSNGATLELVGMTGENASGYLMLNRTIGDYDSIITYSEENKQYNGGLYGNVFSGYSVNFTDTSHTAIASVTKNSACERCRCYHGSYVDSGTSATVYVYIYLPYRVWNSMSTGGHAMPCTYSSQEAANISVSNYDPNAWYDKSLDVFKVNYMQADEATLGYVGDILIINNTAI